DGLGGKRKSALPALAESLRQKRAGKELLRAAEFFRFRFDMRGDEQRLDILPADAGGIDGGELIDHLADRGRVAEFIFFDNVGGDLFLVGTKKVETALHTAQQGDHAVGIGFDFALARDYHHEGKAGNDSADVEEHREALLLQLDAFHERKRRGVDLAGFQRLRARRTVADAIKNFIVAVAHEPLLRESFDRGVLGNAAGAGHADDFAAQIAYLSDALGAHQGVI